MRFFRAIWQGFTRKDTRQRVHERQLDIIIHKTFSFSGELSTSDVAYEQHKGSQAFMNQAGTICG